MLSPGPNTTPGRRMSVTGAHTAAASQPACQRGEYAGREIDHIDPWLQIGKDVDIVAKQTSPIFSQVRPKVDTLAEDIELAGRKMVELLMRRIAGEPPEALQFLDRPSLIVEV